MGLHLGNSSLVFNLYLEKHLEYQLISYQTPLNTTYPQHLCRIWGLTDGDGKYDDGKPFLLICNPDSTIGDLRKEIERATGFSTASLGIKRRGEDSSKADMERVFDTNDHQTAEPVISYFSLHLLIQILVRTLSGKTITIFCESDETVDNIKVKIREKEGVVLDAMRLLFEGRQLDGGVAISSYNIRQVLVYHGSKLLALDESVANGSLKRDQLYILCLHSADALLSFTYL
jgi:hypothetical protein